MLNAVSLSRAETPDLPMVNFGKYKGQSVLELIKDTNYIEWLKQQPWFANHKPIYNIVVNQMISPVNANSKTPEHNRLQNLFLDMENVKALYKYIEGKPNNTFQMDDMGEVKFEYKYNWDVFIGDYHWCFCSCDRNNLIDECDCEIYRQYRTQYNIPKQSCFDKSLKTLFIEIKPILGDDYPCVLRKMKTQIELTNNDIDRENKTTIAELEKSKRNYKITEEEFQFDRRNWVINPLYCLLIGSFSSSTTTKDQLKTIFNQSHIKVIFTQDVFHFPTSIASAPLKETALNETPYSLEQENQALRGKVQALETEIAYLNERFKRV